MLRLEITPLARSQVRDVVRYYAQNATPAIAMQFRNEFRAATKLLALNPGIGSLRYAHLLRQTEIRVWSLGRFPFRVFYVEDGNVLRVVAVDHERRKVTTQLLEW